jgi:hypothetical protein
MSEGETAERALQYLNPPLKIQRIGFASAQLFEEFECVNHVISALTSHPKSWCLHAVRDLRTTGPRILLRCSNCPVSFVELLHRDPTFAGCT